MVARRILIRVGGAFIGLLLLIGIAILALDSGPGRRFVAERIAGFETASGLKFSAGRIEGSLYGRMILRDVAVRDPDGVFMTADRVVVDWRPFAYLRNRVDVRELASPEIRIGRLPALRPVPTDPDAPILPDIDIAIRRLAIDRILLAPPVLGRAHVARLAGTVDIADGRARIRAEAGAQAGDRLALRLDAVPDANRLEIAARLTAPAGGLVDGFTGLGRPLAFAVDGRGDWAKWDGRVRAGSGGDALADLALTARNGTFALKGDTMPGRLFDGPVARLTGPALAIDLTAALAERRADIRFAARSDALAAGAAGIVDLANNRFGKLRIAARLLRPGAIADSVNGRDVRLTAALDGPFATPAIAYTLMAERIGFGTTAIEGLRAEGAARVDAERILIPVNATARRVTGLNAAAGGLLTNLRVNGDLAWSNGRLLSDNLRLRSPRIDATAILIADPAAGRYTGAIKGRVNDYRVDGLGRIALVTDAELVAGATGGFGIQGTFRVTTRTIENAALANALGGTAVTTARFRFDEKGVARLAMLRLDAPDFRITSGEGSYALDSGRIAFRAAGASDQYGPFAVTAGGTLERPQVRLAAARPGLGIDLRDLTAELRGVPQGYAVVARGQSAYGPLTADLLIESGRGSLAVTIRSGTIAGIDVQGRVAQTAAGPFAGRLALAGQGLNGTVMLAAAGADQRADIDMTANAARIPGDVPIRIGEGRVRATAILRDRGPDLTGAFRLADVRQGETIVRTARGRIGYQGGRGTIALVADGRMGSPFTLAAQAALAPDRLVANAKGRLGGVVFRLAAPLVATKQGADWAIRPTTLVVPQGRAVLSGRYGANTALAARLDGMDVAIVQAFVPGLGLGGRASGTIDYAATTGQAVPVLRARLDIDDFTRTSAYVVSAPVDIAFLGTLDTSGGDMRALIRRSGAIVGRMQARLAPLGEGAALTDRLFAAPLSGGVRYRGPAEVLWTLTGIAGQEVTGPLAMAADFGGRLDQPTLNGLVRANGLTYRNAAFGTVISRIAVEGRFSRSELRLTRFAGRAGDGSVSAEGTIGLDAAAGFPVNLNVTLARAQLADSDALAARVSGTLAITNGPGGGLIRGDLGIPEARYRIIRQGAAEVAELEGVRRRTDLPADDKAVQAAGLPADWRLDIRVRADNRIFVSGMGLEAEWATDLRVAGTAANPVVLGSLDVVRGTYSFAGRRFDLAETGAVRFEGGAMTNPELDLAATTTVDGVNATITIGGRAQAPQIAFTSTPSLPQDEVLSRLLFGESVTQLSATQAIQLAAALNSLRGSGGGLNPLGTLRSATGIDRLRVLGADEATGRGTALAAGQYISNDIYVEVITDARGFTATQLEIALSKTLSVLSQTSSFGGSNFAVRYSKDY
jgi:translocation and assembly module TamB